MQVLYGSVMYMLVHMILPFGSADKNLKHLWVFIMDKYKDRASVYIYMYIGSGLVNDQTKQTHTANKDNQGAQRCQQVWHDEDDYVQSQRQC